MCTGNKMAFSEKSTKIFWYIIVFLNQMYLPGNLVEGGKVKLFGIRYIDGGGGVLCEMFFTFLVIEYF